MSWVAHYLDDFVTVGAPDSLECQSNLDRMLLACRRLGVPVAQEKCAGPATRMVFLGFELDSLEMIIRLPEEKLGCTMQLIKEWGSRKACKKRDLESLVGHLQHVAMVVRPGGTFVRWLIELLSSVRSHNHWVRLNVSTRSDLTWWQFSWRVGMGYPCYLTQRRPLWYWKRMRQAHGAVVPALDGAGCNGSGCPPQMIGTSQQKSYSPYC